MKDPTAEVRKYLKAHPGLGIDYLKLGESKGINQITLAFICSDVNPAHPRTMKDIDNLLMHVKVVRELSEDKNDPMDSGATNHRLQISTNKAPEKDDNEETREIERA